MKATKRLYGIGLALLVLGLAACGSSSSSSSSGSNSSASGGSGSSGNSSAFAQQAAQVASKAEAKQTVAPPSSGPKLVAGKSVFVIPCAMAAEGCAAPARAAIEAAKAAGWQATLIDPAGDQTKQAAAVQQAIAAKASGIILEAIDAQVIRGPLEQAKAAGIPVVTFASVDQGNLFSQEIPDDSAFATEGYDLAAGMYGQANHKLHMVMMTGTDSRVVTYRVAGTMKFINQCKAAGGDCSVLAEQNYTIPTISTTAPQLAVTTVRQHPDMTALWVGYDAAATFMIKALQAASLTPGFAGAFDANSANVDVVRHGGYQKFDEALAPTWIGYAQIDSLNRTFSHRPTVNEGLEPKLLTQSDVPASGPWPGDINPVPAYLKIWGK